MNTKTLVGILIATAVLTSACSQQRSADVPTDGSLIDGMGSSSSGGNRVTGGSSGSTTSGSSSSQDFEVDRGSGSTAGLDASGLEGGSSLGGNFADGSGNGSSSMGMNGSGSFQQGGDATTSGRRGEYSLADLRDPSSVLAQRLVFFDYDQATINPEYHRILNAHATLLSDYPELSVRLEGHADERGSREYNVALSERRGDSVMDYLLARGVQVSQMNVVGYGEEVPLAFGENEAAWSKNRRVEIVYIGE